MCIPATLALSEPTVQLRCLLTLAWWQAHDVRVALRLRHSSCSASIKKKRLGQQFLCQAALFSYLGDSWGVWFAGFWALPASMCTHGHSETLSHGISCWSLRNKSSGSLFNGICLALRCRLGFWEAVFWSPVFIITTYWQIVWDLNIQQTN